MTGNEVREAFVKFFESKNHRELPSSSLVPHNDPTVLLTTAGMQQMTPFFLGLETPPHNRLVSVQKCFRTVDIDEVGDESHCTFFFMLGNFSIGDYFKKESLAWSWEFLTEVMGLPADRLYPTVHTDDDESFRIWRDEIGVPAERIGWLEDNWWGPVGPTGPNGPDSEIYFDLGPEFSDGRPDEKPGDGNRYLEIWNNVFMQFMQHEDGSRTPLPRPNVDTGMGLERLTMVMQMVNSIYDSDLYQTIIQTVAGLADVQYGVDEKTDRALRVIADHSRSATFLISDGVLPGNEGRSYILRRILRRAIRQGRALGLSGPFLAEVSHVVISQFGAWHPNLHERQSQIVRVLTHEEESFGRTLTAGEARFDALVTQLRESGETMVPGREVFRLYDTFGFPFDLTVELAQEAGLSVDQAGFDTEMEKQRAASRSADAFKDAARNRAELYVSLAGQKTEFLGYADESADGTILALVGPDGSVESAEAGQPIEVILNRTPFYGESGGQIGDKGSIRTDTGLINIDDTFRPTPDLFVHRGTVAEGFVRVGESARAEIDASRRQSIRRNHTATHLLHRALRIVLGEETHQAGSLVAPERLRFDFTSLEAMTADQVRRVAEIVNTEIARNTPVDTDIKAYADAVEGGAMALFGEKYGDTVRVVQIPGFSTELCGGTHVRATGDIGPFVVVAEGSVAAGVRRIEALTGDAAIERMLSQQRLIEDLARDLRVTWSEVPGAVSAIHDKSRAADREIERLQGRLAGAQAGNLLDSVVEIDGIKVLAAVVPIDSRDAMRQLGDRLRDQLGSGVVVLGSVIGDAPSLIAMVTKDVVGRGVKAGDIVREIA
ncbi:MAG: alanine--tRNA ligase, partial [Thermomicrobiales bacterium]|nr:alanine--tRNA ligase [Thermomicrobiales bacterium]